MRALCPQLPAENIVAEPAKRDTAAAIALGVGWIAARDRRRHDGRAAGRPPHPGHRPAFQHTLRAAAAAAEQTGELVTIGIKPTWACPGFGYIEQGAACRAHRRARPPGFMKSSRFREKPSAELAETFLAAGQLPLERRHVHLDGAATIARAFKRHAPELGDFIARLHAQRRICPAFLRERFPALPKISIDYAVMEKAARVLMVEAAFDWDDVGSWTAVAKYLAGRRRGKRRQQPTLQRARRRRQYRLLRRRNAVALLGVQDLIVVQTADALLVCHRHEAERIKQLVAAQCRRNCNERAPSASTTAKPASASPSPTTSACSRIRWRRSREGSRATRSRASPTIVDARQDRHDRPRPAAQHGRQLRPGGGESARLCREAPRRAARCAVKLWDERLTSVAAQRALHESGRNVKQSRAVIDQVAAQMILQGWLDSQAMLG